MFRKIALCTLFVLILAPASVLAAGGQGQGMGPESGTCLHVQNQLANGVPAQEQTQNGYGQGNGIASRNGDPQMLQTRSCDQTCDQDHAMIRNMTRDQLRTGMNGDAAAGNRQQGSAADPAQNQYGALQSHGQKVQTGQTAGGASPALLHRLGR
jgi:TolA-binding protein